MAIKKAQTGATTSKEKKNIINATQNKNMRNTAPKSGNVKTTMGSKGVVAQGGKMVKKAVQVKKSLNTLLPGMNLRPSIPNKIETSKAQAGKTLKTVKTVKKAASSKRSVDPLSPGMGLAPSIPSKPEYSKAKTGNIIPKKNSVSKNVGNLNKAKSGGSFPDLNKDGKITKADVLKGRGVIAKSGKKMKTCKGGC